MAAKDFGGLSEKEFDDLCKRVKDDADDMKEAKKKKIDEKISAEEERDPKTAFELCKRYYDTTGHKGGGYTLGLFYLRGKGVERNGKEAYDCFQEAVKNGNAAGLRGLRRLYDGGYILVKDDGEEVFKDPKDEYKNPMKGFEALRRAAKEMNNRSSMIHLACDYYENGCPGVVERDLDKAIKWVKRATEGKDGAPYVERAAQFAEHLFKVDKEKSYDLYAYLLDNHFDAVVKVLRPDVLKNLERHLFEKGDKERKIAVRIREYLKTLPRCSNCGLYGHVAHECEHRGPVCYYCHESGHIARDCPKLEARKA